VPPRAPITVELLSPDAAAESASALEWKWPVETPKPKLFGTSPLTLTVVSSVVNVPAVVASSESSSEPEPATETSEEELPSDFAPLAASPLTVVVFEPSACPPRAAMP